MDREETQSRVKEVIGKLEDGVKSLFESDRYREYLRVMSRFYNYSYNNSLLIAMQRPDATLVAGYSSWNRNFNRNVKAGEHGIKIIAPNPYKKKELKELTDENGKTILGKNGKPLTEEVTVVCQSFRVANVFDVSQTEGEELPEIVNRLTGEVDNYEDIIAALKEISPVPIEFEEIKSGANGYYSLEENRIAIKKDLPEQQTIKTILHELGHCILLNKENGIVKDLKQSRAIKELEAESVAFVCSEYLGIDSSSYSFGYLAGWSPDEDGKSLKESLSNIQKASEQIINGLTKILHKKEEMQPEITKQEPDIKAPVHHKAR